MHFCLSLAIDKNAQDFWFASLPFSPTPLLTATYCKVKVLLPEFYRLTSPQATGTNCSASGDYSQPLATYWHMRVEGLGLQVPIALSFHMNPFEERMMSQHVKWTKNTNLEGKKNHGSQELVLPHSHSICHVKHAALLCFMNCFNYYLCINIEL